MPFIRSRVFFGAALILVAASSFAELQDVEMDGYLRIRGRYFENAFETEVTPGPFRIPRGYLPGRPLGPFGTGTRYAFDEDSAKVDFVEHAVRLGFKADFSHDISTYVQFFHSNRWGRGEFRSDYRTGGDFFTAANRDVQMLQAYIDAKNVFGSPLTLRIGRQNLVMGSGWLVSSYSGINDRPFDGVLATWSEDRWSVQAFYTQLSEISPSEEDEDVTFSGLHGSVTVTEHLTVEPYWYWVRDPRSLNDTNFTAPVEWLENAFDIDDYDPTNLHTTGLRVSGEAGAWDYEAEAAYQFGNADAIGQRFSAFGTYGDDDAEFDAWAMDATVGYTFDGRFQPRLFANFAYFSGEDNRDISFREWINPFDRQAEASLSFNRLFSSTTYSFIWDRNKNHSNFSRVALGVGARFSDKVSGEISLGKYWVNDVFDRPRSITVGGYRVPLAPSLAFWTEPSSDDLGYGLESMLRYDYSDDVMIRLVYQAVFSGDGVGDGNFQDWNGLEFLGGSGQDDAQYAAAEVIVRF